ncbi:MAG: hypothetical protein IKO07_06455 [Clostridia bacterium]|nr:hypothetical protein [Clostridia bacterium]
MKNHDFQELVDLNLSGLVWDERKRRRVLCAVRKEEKPVKRISRAFVLAAVAVCLSVTALAAGVVFSNRVDVTRLAEDALFQKYGVSAEMLSYFSRDIEDQTVRYEGIGPLNYVLGRYTVTVNGGKADAAWSWDGEPTGGLDSRAWGAEQLQEMCDECRRSINAIDYYVMKAEVIAQKNGVDANKGGVLFNQAEAEAQQEKERRDAEKAKSLARLSISEMETIAREAIALRYNFTPEQSACLTSSEEGGWYRLFGDDELPCCAFFFSLGYDEDGYQGPGRGAYHATINALDGTVEDIFYDADLAGNG